MSDGNTLKQEQQAQKDEQNNAQVSAAANLAATVAERAGGAYGKVASIALRNEKVQSLLATANKYKKYVALAWTLTPFVLFLILVFSVASLVESLGGGKDSLATTMVVLTQCTDGADAECVKEVIDAQTEERINNANNTEAF